MKRALIVLLLITLSSSLFAASFILERYDVTIDIDSSRLMHWTERMDAYFTMPSHGIIRDIQYRFPSYDGYPETRAEVSNIRSSVNASVERDNTYVSIRLGDANRIITGENTFLISYDYNMGKDYYDDYDEVYVNIVSANAWDSDIGEAVFTINLPFPVDEERIWVTYGYYGSDAELPFELSDDGLTLRSGVRNLPRGAALTVRIEMDEGYFVDAVNPYKNAFLFLIAGIAFTIILVGAAFFLYFTKCRSDKLIIPVQFAPPEGMAPMDISYILNKDVGDDSVGAMLFYWADKGYIEIVESEKGQYTFSKLKDGANMSEREGSLFSAFFSSDSVDGRALRVSDFPTKLRTKVIPKIRKFFSGERELYDESGKKARKMTSVICVIAALMHIIISTLMTNGAAMPVNIVVGFMAFMASKAFSSGTSNKKNGPLYLFMAFFYAILGFIFYVELSAFLPAYIAGAEAISFIISIFVPAFIALYMEKRSKYGDDIYAKILGFREYIDKVEKDRIRLLSEEDPHYFYHILSYAMVFGLAEKWCAKFEGITVESVSWYRPYGGMHNLMAFAYFQRRWASMYRSQVMPPRQGGSGGGRPTHSGFSGRAGGGFSGGGGRAW